MRILIVEDDRELASSLDKGADEYVGKPFEPMELIARARAVLRRYSLDETGCTQFGNLSFDLINRSAMIGENAQSVPRRELAVLEALIRRRGASCSATILKLPSTTSTRRSSPTCLIPMSCGYASVCARAVAAQRSGPFAAHRPHAGARVMRRPNSIAFPVTIVLVLGMALMMVISTVLTVAVFLLTDGQSRKKIAV